MKGTNNKSKEKALYFLKRAKETSDLATKLVLLNNSYNSFDSLKPAYAVVFLNKYEFQTIINACANDSDCDVQCSLTNYNLENFCNLLQAEIEKCLN